MRLPLFALPVAFLCLAISPAAQASETAAEHAANVYAVQQLAAAPAHGNLPDYALPPDKLAKAQHLETIRTAMDFGGTAWSLLQFILLLWLGVIAWMRNRALASSAALRAENKTKRAFWLECLVFTCLYNLLSTLLDLPLSLYHQHLARSYGLSVQSWGGWWIDFAKSFALGLLGGFLLFALLMWLIRKLPRSWWLVGWAVVTPLLLFFIYLSPYVLDPLFNKFEPLQQSHPELVTRLEQVVAKGHMDIPPERMFLMKASAKVTTLNAYVTGFGSSKRVVVWDTSLQKGTPDQVLFIFGHESGHYVLGHVMRGVLLLIVGLLLSFFVGYILVRWSLRRFGGAWAIPSEADWGTLVVLFFAFALLSAVAQPLANTLSRTQEHAADVYGQEAIHGLVGNPQEVARSAFELLGANSFVVPNPNLFLEFWTDSHPAIGRRAAFAHAYDPWTADVAPKYFPKP